MTQSILLLFVQVLFISLVSSTTQTLQLPGGPNENVLTFWPGELSLTPQERCAIAITQTKVFRIVGWKSPRSQSLPSGSISAGILNNLPTNALWLGIAKANGKVEWTQSAQTGCDDPFPFGENTLSFDFSDTGVTWDRALTRREDRAGIAGEKAVVTVIGDKLVVVFGFDEGTGQPIVRAKYKIPNNFPSATSRKVVGYGEGLPFQNSNKPSLAVARQITDGNQTTGELILVDQERRNPPVARYFPNLHGWQSHAQPDRSVAAIGLMDPFPGFNAGTILGFLPHVDQPLSLSFPWTTGRRWSSAVSWTQLTTSSSVGIIIVGKEYPGDFLQVHFVLMSTSGDIFELLQQRIEINQTVWIPNAPSFISAPLSGGMEPHPKIWFSAQNAQGPVLFQADFPKNPSELESGPKEEVTEFSSYVTSSLKRSVLCDKTALCKVLSPTNVCGGECCQTYLPPKSGSKFSSVCCKDCNLGSCVGNPGSCVH